MNFDPNADRPIDGDTWFSEVQASYLEQQRAEMIERYGEDAVDQVIELTSMIADLIYIGRDNIPFIKAGVKRMAELVNEMLPSLNTRHARTRLYNHKDLDGVMGEIPTDVQDLFVALVGTVLLNSKGGPYEAAVTIERSVDGLAEWMKNEGRDR